MNVLVIGGGASGMLAALTAAENPENRVMLAERQSRVGRKLAATGNGRCNLTNRHAAEEYYHGKNPAFVRPALARFPVEDTLSFFEQLGLLCTEESSGRVYPFSDSAGSVVDVLRLALDASGVELLAGAEVRSLTKGKKSFTAELSGEAVPERLTADAVIVACGGIAGTKLGGTDLGYRLLKQLGHSCGEVRPSLVQLCTDKTLVHSLKGIRTTAAVSLISRGRILAESSGEVQFTEYGVSGPAVFEISRSAAFAPKGTEVRLNLLPQMSTEQLYAFLSGHCRSYPHRTLENLLTGTLQNRLGRTVLRACGHAFEQEAGTLSESELRAICGKLQYFTLNLEGTMGMEQAQVTAGGAATSEFDPQTLESRICPGLYACGEVLDIDGDCGGFNLQWAWSSGRLAGQLLHR